MRLSTSANELAIEIVEIKKAVLVYRAINHKLRQQMMKLIHKKDKMTVTDLQ